MKIFLHDYGGYAFSLQLANHLAVKGENVDYIHGGGTQLVQRFSSNGNNSTRLKVEGIRLSAPFNKYSFFKRWVQEREYARLLKQRILSEKPDVVISANAPLDVQYLAWKASRQLQVPFIFWWQDVISLATRELLAKKFGRLGHLIGVYYQRLERKLLRRSERVIAISDKFRSLAGEWGVAQEKLHVLPNWAPLEDIPLLPKNNPWACAHGAVDKFVFLYAGVLGLKHDPQVFVSLAEQFMSNSGVMVIVVSEGLGADWLKEQKQLKRLSNLVVLPFQPYEDFASMLASADVLMAVLDQQAGSYSVPSKVLSYLCAGKPVLLSAPLENDAAMMLQEHEMGLVSPPRDDEQMCCLAQKLFCEPELRALLSNNARVYAEDAFDIQAIAQKFLAIL